MIGASKVVFAWENFNQAGFLLWWHFDFLARLHVYMLFLPKVQGDVDENYASTIRSLHWEADFTRSGVVVPRLLASRQTSSGVRSSRDERTPNDVCGEATRLHDSHRNYPGYQRFFLACDEELRRPQADTSSAEGRRHERRTKFGSFHLSGKLPTYPSPKATLILTSHLR